MRLWLNEEDANRKPEKTVMLRISLAIQVKSPELNEPSI
jgi:hypothetical protein